MPKTLTYDQAKEMAEHECIVVETAMSIYYTDQHAPWQRCTNENTNGRLRQYFPEGTTFVTLTQNDFVTAAASLNERPRKTLGYATPNEHFTKLIAIVVGIGTRHPTTLAHELVSTNVNG